MKKIIKLILIVICFILFFNLVIVNHSTASSKSNVQLSSTTIDFFIFVRVEQGNTTIVYIYTEFGIYVGQYEEV